MLLYTFAKLICRGGTASACCTVSSLGRRLRGSRSTGGEVSSTPPSPQPVEWARPWAEAETSETWSDTHTHILYTSSTRPYQASPPTPPLCLNIGAT
ncbi:hypothetical protein GGP41_007256 [Bipolaris sorokiniana]|uniref:Uncharacterized protein n=1 Tax=Cochliobolus sativus TaxID=45130 RepID=A0A8H5ZQA5_COCSA|nr:hypothetical protein GGP41_007256 [Bipolaris sorokiniana]